MNSRYPYSQAISIATDLVSALAPSCEPDRCIVAGSLRRRSPTVGDIELLYISRTIRRRNPDNMFEFVSVPLIDATISSEVEVFAFVNIPYLPPESRRKGDFECTKVQIGATC